MRAFVTGASSGIGAGLVARWAVPGARLGLVARRAQALEGVATAARAAGAEVHVFPADVGDTAAMEAAAAAFLGAVGGVDVVVANAGIGIANRLREGQAAEVAELFRTNLIGVTNTVLPFVPAMIAAGSGVLVGMGSVAGFRALPGRAAYCASKAAIRTFMDGLRLELRGTGVHAMTICPGFVTTPMSARLPGKRPFEVSLEDAVGRIGASIQRRDRVYTFPAPMAALAEVWTRLPEELLPRIMPAGPHSRSSA